MPYLPTRSLINWANSRMVCSSGFPYGRKRSGYKCNCIGEAGTTSHTRAASVLHGELRAGGSCQGHQQKQDTLSAGQSTRDTLHGNEAENLFSRQRLKGQRSQLIGMLPEELERSWGCDLALQP